MTPEERLAALLREAGKTKASARVTSRSALPVLRALVELTADGPSPSVREIADRADVASTSTVGHHLKTLAELKLVRLPENRRPRSLWPTDAGRAVFDEREMT